MKTGDDLKVKVAFGIAGILVICFAAACGGGGGGGGLTEDVTPVVSALDYAGSSECETCHKEIYNSWKNSLHNKEQLTPSDVNMVCDSDYDGTNDFKESGGTNLATVATGSAAWGSYGANAPVLGYDSSSGTYTVTIGAVTHNIVRVMSGLGWKQRYMTNFDGATQSLYILPAQYNPANNTWTAYTPANWYTGTTPIYGAGDSPISKGKQKDSWERRCIACHGGTGVSEVSLDSNSEYVATYSELNTACEACHGPGAKHVSLGGGAGTIINPDNLSHARALEVCGQCHANHGSGKYTLGGQIFGYAWSADNEPYRPGDILDDFYTFPTYSTVPTDFWNDVWFSSKNHGQQLLDLQYSKHYASGMTCTDCHEPHGSSFDGDVRDNADDNSLCMACHGYGSSNPVIVNWATGATIGSDNDVSGHTGHAVDAQTKWKPGAGSGSRCISCHMPFTAKSAIEWDDPAHNFKILWPAETNRIGGANRRPNSCMTSTCHTVYDNSTNKWSEDIEADNNSATAYINGTTAWVNLPGGFTNVRSVADAGIDKTGTVGIAVELDGSKSFSSYDVTSPYNDGLTYSWLRIQGPSATLSDSTAQKPTFTPASAGIYVFQIVVNDGTLDSDADSVTVTVSQ
jgi:predicted CXXCH cytochrome family protein